MTRTLEGQLSVDKLLNRGGFDMRLRSCGRRSCARKGPDAGKHRAKAGASQVLRPLGDGQKHCSLDR